MDLISAGIILLVFIVLVVFTVLSAKTWHWVNVVFVNLTFLAAVGASIGLAQVYHYRQRDMTAFDQARSQFEQAMAAHELAVSGRPDSATYDPDSLRYKEHQVHLLFLGRGQVWANGTVAVDGDKRKFTFATPRPAEDTTRLKDVEYHLFADDTIQEQAYPVSYIGRVKVVSETPEALELEAVKIGDFSVIIDPEQWGKPSTTWTLFEQFPLDRRDTFRKLIELKAATAENPSDEEKILAEAIAADQEEIGSRRRMEIGPYRNQLETVYLRPEALNLQANDPEYEKLIDTYAFDGFPLGKIKDWVDANSANRSAKSFEPTAEEVFVRYKFNQASRNEYEVDSKTGSLQTDGAFTVTGLAVDPSLHSGKAIRFEEGAEVLIDKMTAEGERGNEAIKRFETEEDVTKLEEIFVRKLRNFPYLFTNINIRSDEVEKDIERIRAGIQVETIAYENAEKQRSKRDEVIAGLKSDQQNLQLDLNVAQALLQTREQQLQALRTEAASFKDKINELYFTIQQKNRAIEKAVATGF
jgi:hypothetical protein